MSIKASGLRNGPENTPVLRYLAAFGLEETAPIEQILGWMVQAVLAQGPQGGMPLHEVAASIKTATGLDFDSHELRRCIETNTATGVTVTTNETPYCLITPASREDTLLRLKRADETEKLVLQEWVDELKTLPCWPTGVKSDELLADFRLFCASVSLCHGVETVALIYEKPESQRKFLEGLDANVWANIPERVSGYRQFCRENFPGFFLQATGARAAFAGNVLDRTFELCRLNLAPSTSKILVEQLAGLTAYLDTNMVFRLLGIEGPAEHLDVRRMIEHGHKAKVVFRITQRTIAEFDSAIKGIFKRKRNIRILPPEALIKLDPNLDDNSYLQEYHRLLTASRSNQLDLLASFNFVGRILERLGVVVWTEKESEVEKHSDKLNSLTRELRDNYEKREEKKSPNQRREITWDLAEHDAFHLVLIDLLRPKRARSFTERKFWFLTSHVSLARRASQMAGDGVPQVILFEHWCQLLRSVLPRSQNFSETFVRSLRSPLFQAHRADYAKAHQVVLGRLASQAGLPSEHFANIFADRAFMAKVAVTVMQDKPDVDSEVAALVDQRVLNELERERQQRVEVTQKLREETKRAESALATATMLSERLRSNDDDMKQLRQELAKVSSDLTEEKAAVGELKGFKEDLKKYFSFGSAFVVVLLTVALWIWFRDGMAIRGLPVNIVAATVFMLSLAYACADYKHRRWGAIATGAGFLIAVISAPLNEPKPVVTDAMSGIDKRERSQTKPTKPAEIPKKP